MPCEQAALVKEVTKNRKNKENYFFLAQFRLKTEVLEFKEIYKERNTNE